MLVGRASSSVPKSLEDYGSTDDTVHLFEKDLEEEEARKERPSIAHYLVGSVFVIVVIVCIPVSAACTQALGGVVPPFELNLCRYVTELTLITPTLLVKGCDLKAERSQIKWLLVAGLMSSTYAVFYYTATLYLPLATQSGVAGVFYLIIVFVMNVAIDRTLSPRLASAVLMALVGAILITQPEVIFHEKSSGAYNPVCKTGSQFSNETWDDFEIKTSEDFITMDTNLTVTSEVTADSLASPWSWPSSPTPSSASPVSLSSSAFSPSLSSPSSSLSSSSSYPNQIVGYILLVGSSASHAIQSTVVNKRLGDVDSRMVNVYVSLTGIAVSVITMAVFEHPTFPSSATCILLLLGHALSLGLSNLCEQKIYKTFQPTVVSIAVSLTLIVSLVAQRTVMSSVNPGKHNDLEIVGGVFIFAGTLVSPLYTIYQQYRDTQ